MQEQFIDDYRIALYLEELRRNPEDRDSELDELVELYRLQQQLERRYYSNNL